MNRLLFLVFLLPVLVCATDCVAGERVVPEVPTNFRANLTVFLFGTLRAATFDVDEVIDLTDGPPEAPRPRQLMSSMAYSIVGRKNFLSVSDEIGRVVVFRKDEVRAVPPSGRSLNSCSPCVCAILHLFLIQLWLLLLFAVRVDLF
jgi:hypothetical protein